MDKNDIWKWIHDMLRDKIRQKESWHKKYAVYHGKLLEWVTEKFKFHFDVVIRVKGQRGFLVLSRRWVVERTFD